MRRLLTSLFILGLGVSNAQAEAVSGDADNGKKLFKQCASCHQIGEGAKHRVGPQLNGIFGRVAGTHEGVRYSKAFQKLAAEGVEWHAETLTDFLENPRAFAKGTRMSYRGMKDPDDRRDLIAYLRLYSDDPADIPEADPTAQAVDHDLDPAILALVGDVEYGEYLSSECTTCHQASGGDSGIPSIINWPEDAFVIAMHGYKNKTRENPVMQLVAGRLSNDEIAALAAYFAAVEE